MTASKEDKAKTGKTTRPAADPRTGETPATHCTETWEEALDAGYFGEAYDDGELVFPGPPPEVDPDPPPPDPPEADTGTHRRKT